MRERRNPIVAAIFAAVFVAGSVSVAVAAESDRGAPGLTKYGEATKVGLADTRHVLGSLPPSLQAVPAVDGAPIAGPTSQHVPQSVYVETPSDVPAPEPEAPTADQRGSQPEARSLAVGPAGQIRSQGFSGITSDWLHDFLRDNSNCPRGPVCVHPLNPSLAVGPTGVLETVDEVMLAKTKAGGWLFAMPLWSFFSLPAGQTGRDPRSFYLPNLSGGRWLIVQHSSGSEFSVPGGGTTQGAIWIALSQTNDVVGTWDTWMIADAGVPDRSAVGLSDNKLVISAHEASDTTLWAIDLADLANGGGISFASHSYGPTYDLWIPAVGQPTTSGRINTNDVYAVTRLNTGPSANAAMLTRVQGSVLAGTTTFANPLDLTSAGVAPFDRQILPQGASPYATPDTIALMLTGPTQAIVQAGHVWFTATAQCTDVTCVQLTEIVPTSSWGQPAVANDIRITAEAGVHTFSAGIGLTRSGRLEVVYDRSSATEHVGAYQVQRSSTDPAGAVSAPTLLNQGVTWTYSSYLGTPYWNDFAAVAQDPTATDVVWQASTVTNVYAHYDTLISQLTQATGAPTGTLTVDNGAYYAWFYDLSLSSSAPSTSAATLIKVSLPSPNINWTQGVVLPLGSLYPVQKVSNAGDDKLLTYQIGDGRGHWSSAKTVPLRDPAAVIRLSGADRNATAATTSAKTFGSPVPVAYVATGSNFPDALAAGAVAGRQGGPVLMVSKDAIPAATANELKRLKPAKIYVLGGTGAVSNVVVDALKAYTSGTVTRLAGSSRFATAIAVANDAYPRGTDIVFLAYAYNFPDALSGAAAASAYGAPILLTDKATLTPETKAEIAHLNAKTVVLLGSTGVISSAIETDLATQYRVVRWGGRDRFETSAIIALNTWATCGDDGQSECFPNAAYLATAYNYPDALAGAAAAGWTGGPVILVQPTSLAVNSPPVIALQYVGPRRIVVLGGTGAVSNALFEAARQYVR